MSGAARQQEQAGEVQHEGKRLGKLCALDTQIKHRDNFVFAPNCRQLRVLRLGWNSLGLRAARSLAEGLKLASALEQLHLGWSGVTDSGIAHIAKVCVCMFVGEQCAVFCFSLFRRASGL